MHRRRQSVILISLRKFSDFLCTIQSRFIKFDIRISSNIVKTYFKSLSDFYGDLNVRAYYVAFNSVIVITIDSNFFTYLSQR